MSNLHSNLNSILIAVSLIVSGVCLWQIWSLKKLKKVFFKSSAGSDLESVIYDIHSQVYNLRNEHDSLESAFVSLKEKTAFAVQRVGLVRFNPFQDGGGNFSFSLALLDDRQNGVIITSMYGREQNRIYTKKIEGGKCENQLTEEEAQAVEQAHLK